MAKKRVKADAIAAAGSLEEVDRRLKEVGDLQRRRQEIETDMNQQMADLKARSEELVKPFNQKIREHFAAIQAYCEAHRAEMTDGGKRKTVWLGSGVIKWRTRPGKVSVRGLDAVIATLRNLGLNRFLRTKVEINKEAILSDPEAVSGIKGISVVKGEDFVIEPIETKLEEVQ